MAVTEHKILTMAKAATRRKPAGRGMARDASEVSGTGEHSACLLVDLRFYTERGHRVCRITGPTEHVGEMVSAFREFHDPAAEPLMVHDLGADESGHSDVLVSVRWAAASAPPQTKDAQRENTGQIPAAA